MNASLFLPLPQYPWNACLYYRVAREKADRGNSKFKSCKVGVSEIRVLETKA